MKSSINLPRLLRALFAFLRIMTLILAVFWLVTLTYNTWIQHYFGRHIIATVGEISLPTAPGALNLTSATAPAKSLSLSSVRGTLQVDLASQDPALGSALRLAIIPSMAVLIAFSYVLFTALRDLCGNLARGEVFNDINLRLVRRIGVNLIAYCLVSAGLEIWASFVLGHYFQQHVVLTGLQTPLPFGSASTLQFHLSPGLITAQGGVLIGCLVLVVAEAFRQGLALKAENDLTV
ncbi:DUF2975 domain-containing protein [Horticoccus luteus]|uniref:DUF2975 domain-containing protein n=1 Tax=Horticoccus luteus TaxID=2862869 RepID=A0A8F9XLK7_9BACT|nr:DUF2975 domain-containing protein [Horticoccus luteus]QYM79134.1 DUF2975 domain-containing protein [Horticoccus luteus]